MKKIFLAIAGIFLIFIGIIGLVVPVMPGWVFIFMGLSLASPEVASRLKRRLLRLGGHLATVWQDPQVVAGFTTRRFPLFLKKTDDLLDKGNQEKLRKRIPGKQFVFLNQVHGENIEVLDRHSRESGNQHYVDPRQKHSGMTSAGVYPREGGGGDDNNNRFVNLLNTDGVLTNIPELTILVLSADCLPIFLRGDGWIGLVHAGWRGTRGRIAAKAFGLLKEKSGVEASQIRVAFGPRICKEHYEVGREFQEFFPVEQRHGKFYFDLAGENKRQILEAGASPQNIADPAICTFCGNRKFYSSRREKEKAKRMISFIRLRRKPRP